MRVQSAIILTGGEGTRLAPLNNTFNKHMVPVYNKFVIDYPIETLKQMGVKNLTVVLGGNHYSQIVDYLKSGKQIGMKINFIHQDKPAGIAEAISLCQPFVEHKDNFAVILGDNVFENPVIFKDTSTAGAQIVLHDHAELQRFGVASIKDNSIVKIEEKPQKLSNEYKNYAITGCYLFDNQFFKFYTHLRPSPRGEFEITDILHMYNQNKDLDYTFNSGLWSDAGTHQSINFINNYFYNKEFKV